jgi:ABC-type transport system involved in multi-copper enzyme maturation permease subunit
MIQLGSLTWITFLESLRHRVLVAMLLASMALMGFGFVLSALAVRDQQLRVAIDFGLFSLGLISVIIAIIMGVILVYKEIERKTIYTLLSKPVPRPLFILGKYAGLTGVLLGTLILLSVAWVLLLTARGGSVESGHIIAVSLVFAEVMLITSIAIWFSTFASPILSGIFTLGIFLIGRNIPIIEHMLKQKDGFFQDNPVIHFVGSGLVRICPDLTVFQVSDALVHGYPVGWGYAFSAWAYAFWYISIFISLGILIFQRRDFI